LLDKNFLNKLNETDKVLESSLSNREKRKAVSDMLSVITDYIRSQDESANTTPLIKLIGSIEELDYGTRNILKPEDVQNRPISLTNNILMAYLSAAVTLLKDEGATVKEAIATASEITGIDKNKIKDFRDDVISNKRDRESTNLYNQVVNKKRLKLEDKNKLALSILQVVKQLSD
tara:strand:- start:126 stop:650 length:525 start_codon:yes stop_codon:yes gene_type:complete